MAKLDATGQLQWSSYLGGSASDEGLAIAADAEGNALVTGYTESPDFPATPGAYDEGLSGSRDAFVAKVSPSGQLVWATHLGGSGYDHTAGIATDAEGNVLVTGFTQSDDFPVPGGFATTYHGEGDGFVAKLSASGTDLLWSSYLGGSESEHATRIAADTTGDVVVTGFTDSSTFNAATELQEGPRGGWDIFVAKVTASGNQLLWTSFIGGSNQEQAYGIAVSPAGSVLVTGRTRSSDFPTPGGFDTSFNGGGYDVFVARVADSGQLEWASYIGGTDSDQGHGVAVGGGGNTFIVGHTNSDNFPAFGPDVSDNSYNGNGDAFVAKLSAVLNVLSAPIVDVPISGTYAGQTPYTVDSDHLEAVSLTAPESQSVGGKTYYFAFWSVDNEPLPPPSGQPFNYVEFTMDVDHTAVAQYNWRLPGDVTGDCKVTVLDLIFVRNHLFTVCEESE